MTESDGPKADDFGHYRTGQIRPSLTDPSLAAISSEFRRVGILGQPSYSGTVMYSSEIGTTTPATQSPTTGDPKAKLLANNTGNVRSLQPYNSGSPKQSSCDYQRSKLAAALANNRQIGVEPGYADSAYGSNISTGSAGFAATHNFVTAGATLPYGSLPNPTTTASGTKGYLPPSYGKVASGSVAILQRRNQSRQQHKIHRSLSDSKYSDGYNSAGGVQTAQKAGWIGMSRVSGTNTIDMAKCDVILGSMRVSGPKSLTSPTCKIGLMSL